MKPKIYIAHQYGDVTHFKALYDYAGSAGYRVSGQIILGKRTLRNKVIQSIRDKRYKDAIIMMWEKFRFYTLHNKILIVGLAPYDGMMIKYEKIFKRNRTFYMTSWTTWDGTDFPRGNIGNKQDYERILRTCFEGVFCVSEKAQKSIKNFLGNTSVVNHAIDYDLYKKKEHISVDKKKYLYIGQYIERKNISVILKWLEKFDKGNVEVFFAGSGELEHIICESAKKDSRITNLGFCTKRELQGMICKYDYVVLPSKEEPFGIVLLEALASGVPCIVSNADGPMEIITDEYNGFVFDLDEGQDGFNKVMERSYYITDGEYICMSKNALESGKKYDSKNVICKWLELLA